MSSNLIIIDELNEEADVGIGSHEVITCSTNDRKEPKSKSSSCGPVDELCTCVGFLTCQDPDNYDVLVDDDNVVIDDNAMSQRRRTSRDPLELNISQPDPPQPDPPATTHSVLVQRNRENYDVTAEASIVNESESVLPVESFDVIVYSPSKEHQYIDVVRDEQNNSTSSPMTATTTSTARRHQRPEEYEPLIMIVDDDDEDNQYKHTRNMQLSPISNRAVRDTSSTSSLQYHRRSPMLLSYASPQHEAKYREKYSTRNYHQHLQSLVQQEISKRTSRRSHRPTKEAPADRYYNGSVNDNDDDRYGYDNIHHGDQYRDVNPIDISHTRTSYLEPSIILNHHHTRTNRIYPVHQLRERLNDTDTVRAVAPVKVTSYNDDDNLSFQEHYHLPPTDQVIICSPPRSSSRF